MKIGDIVEVVNNLRTYCSYVVWAKRNNLTRWTFDDGSYTRIKHEKTYLPREGHPYKIIAIDIYTRPDQKDNGLVGYSDILYGIEDLETGHQYIIHNSAVCFIRSGEKQLQFSF